MPDQVYYDSSIWVSLFVPNRMQRPIAYDLYQKILNGEHTCYISRIVQMEVTHAIRTRLIQCEPYTGLLNNNNKRNLLELMVTEAVADFTTMVRRGMQKKNIVMIEYNGSMRKMHVLAAEYMEQIRIGDYFSERHNKHGEYVGYQYKGPGHIDIQHAMLARTYSCSTFYTFDRGFYVFEDMNEFAALKFKIY